MKTKFLIVTTLVPFLFFGQTATMAFQNQNKNLESTEIGPNGYNFELVDAGENSKYSDFCSGFFRNKLIAVSSKKVGDFAKKDPNTKEAYKELYCLDMSNKGYLSNALLFSSTLNTRASEDQIAFTPDQKTAYFTRSTRKKSLEFKLFKATLEKNESGNWINEELLDINEEGASIETPFINAAGDKLYFASNRSGTLGGYDIFVAPIQSDGSLGTPKNLGSNVNTASDEKYPSLSQDGKYLYFSSKGHRNLGGFDLFASRILKTGYKTPRNMGNTINTRFDEVAYYASSKDSAYVSSNKPENIGSFDIYIALNKSYKQDIKGEVTHHITNDKLSNTLIVLLDEDRNEITRQLTGPTGSFHFENITPFETYFLSTFKNGFKDEDFEFTANKTVETTYIKNLELNPEIPVIIIDNIYFDYDGYSLRKESTGSLLKIVELLKQNPNTELIINAHTDVRGKKKYNYRLSRKRSKAVMKYLVKNGIDKARLTPRNHGEVRPIINCNVTPCTEKDHQTNRRIEFEILLKEKEN